MRGLGIVALALTVLSFFFWLVSWLYWNILLESFGFESPMRYVAMASTAVSLIFELLAIGLLSVGLIMAAKRLPKV